MSSNHLRNRDCERFWRTASNLTATYCQCGAWLLELTWNLKLYNNFQVSYPPNHSNWITFDISIERWLSATCSWLQQYDERDAIDQLTQRHSAKYHLSLADVARPVLMHRATCAAIDAVHVLVALGRVLGEVDAGAEHSANVRVPLVETCTRRNRCWFCC